MRLKSCGLLPLMTLFLSVSAGNRGKGKPPQGDCPKRGGWHQHGINCYYVHFGSGRLPNQTEARRECQRSNAELTSINDAAEADFLISKLAEEKKYWIGLMSNGSNTTYWLDGSNSTYHQILPCDVSTSDDNSECFVIERESTSETTGEVSKEDCTTTSRYICKRITGIPTTHAEAVAVTTASSMPSNGPDDAFSKTTAGLPGTTSNDSFSPPAETEVDANGTNIGVAVGVSIGLGLLVLVAIIVAVIVVYRRRNTKQGCCRRYDSNDPYQSVDGRQQIPHVYQTMPNGESNYEELTDTPTPPAVVPIPSYNNRPATTAPGNHQSPYNDGETTLVDNALYGGETGKLPRSPDGYEDVDAVHLSSPGPTAATHHPVYNDNDTTLMDNALYEKETAISPRSPDGYEDVNTTEASFHQQPVYSDHDTTLVDNTLYGSETSAPTSNNPQNNVDYQDLTVIDNALYDRR